MVSLLGFLGLLAGAGGVTLGSITWHQLDGRTQLGSMQVGTVSRHYRVYRPAAVIPRPGLVIVLHSAGGSALQAEAMTGFDREADRLGWIVAYPDGVLDGWDAFACCRHAGVDDVAFISGLIGSLEAADGVGPGRVFVTGLSRGGMMSYRLACELSTRVAAIAAVSGNMATPGGSAEGVPCRPQNPVSVLAIHGTADPRVPINGGRTDLFYAPLSAVVGVWRSLEGCAGQPAVGDSGPSTTTTWSCARGSQVTTRVVDGGTHAWPGAPWPFADPPPDASFNASAVIADFFAAHPRH
jgi:polyhydroxybutyrate depolymerase